MSYLSYWGQLTVKELADQTLQIDTIIYSFYDIYTPYLSYWGQLTVKELVDQTIQIDTHI